MKATDAQIHYIEVLAIDLQMDRLNRNWAIEAIVNRPIKFLDELTVGEASKVIDDFKERKEEL